MKNIWKFFASIRLSVVVLLTIAVASIGGTLIPQNKSLEAYVATFGDPLTRVFYTLDLFDMYSSWWFQTLLVLLVLNILVCSIDRLPTTWKVVFANRAVMNPSRFRNLKNRESIDSTRSLEVLRDGCRKLVPGGEGIQGTPEGFYILGEKGRWTRFGVYAVHLSIILLLVGALVGSMYGFDGYVNIAEGESVASVRLSNTGESQRLDFELRCDDFDVSFYPNTGTPKEYRSTLTVIERGEPVLHKDIIVNAPLRYKGINVFQSSYGQLSPDRVELVFTSSETGEAFKAQAVRGVPLELPEALGSFTLLGYQERTDFRGQDVGASFVGELTPKEGTPETILLPVQFPTFDQMRKGSVAVSISHYDTRYYTGLQVTRDPGVWLVYSGFMMLIIGCFITFFTSHQRLFVEVVQTKGTCRVTVAGSANKNTFGMQQEVKRIAGRLAGL